MMEGEKVHFPNSLSRKCSKLNNLFSALFNTRKRQNIFNMFGRKNNSGMIWASILGLGASAAAYGLGRNRNKNQLSSIQNMMKNFRIPNAGQTQKSANLMEISKELIPNKNLNKYK